MLLILPRGVKESGEARAIGCVISAGCQVTLLVSALTKTLSLGSISLSWDDKWTWKHTLSIIFLLYLYLHITITDQVLAL